MALVLQLKYKSGLGEIQHTFWQMLRFRWINQKAFFFHERIMAKSSFASYKLA